MQLLIQIASFVWWSSRLCLRRKIKKD